LVSQRKEAGSFTVNSATIQLSGLIHQHGGQTGQLMTVTMAHFFMKPIFSLKRVATG